MSAGFTILRDAARGVGESSHRVADLNAQAATRAWYLPQHLQRACGPALDLRYSLVLG